MKNKFLFIPYMVAFTGIVMAVLQSIFGISKMEVPSIIIFCAGFISMSIMVSLMETESLVWNRVVLLVGAVIAGTFAGAFYAGVFAPKFQPVESWSTGELLGAYRYHSELVYQKARVIMLIVVVILLFLRLILSSKGLLLKDR